MTIAMGILFLFAFPPDVLLGAWELGNGPGATLLRTSVAVSAVIVMCALARLWRVGNRVTARNLLMTKADTRQIFTARLDYTSYRWVIDRLPSRVLTLYAAGPVTVRGTTTAIELWTVLSSVPEQLLGTISWSDVTGIQHSKSVLLDRKIVVQCGSGIDLALILGSGSYFSLSSRSVQSQVDALRQIRRDWTLLPAPGASGSPST